MMQIREILDRPVQDWFAGEQPEGDVVLSGRVRLARNLAGMRFPGYASPEERAQVEQQTRRVLSNLAKEENTETAYIRMEELTDADRQVLVEKHLISPQLVADTQGSGIVVDKDAGLTIMVNEEDHFRIQCLGGGLQLPRLWQRASHIDDLLEAQLDFAYDNSLGYLTACPTNVGTGLRASVMVHVPALVRTRKIQRLIQSMLKVDFSVRGLYGEGTDMAGNILQISNQVTLGVREEDVVARLQSLGEQLAKEERAAREQLKGIPALTDEVWRAYGVLRYARSLSGDEALTLLSTVELGRILGIIPHMSADAFREMLVTTRPGFLQRYAHSEEQDVQTRDTLRAAVVRDSLQKMEKE